MQKLQIPAASNFDSFRALELANLIQVAYCQFNDFTDPNIPNFSKNDDIKVDFKYPYLSIDSHDLNQALQYKILAKFEFTELKLFSSKIVPFGFIAQRDFENGTTGIFIVFRGTATKSEWYQNARAKQIDFLGDENLGRVTKGFNTIYTRSLAEKNIISFSIAKLKSWLKLNKKTDLNNQTSLEETVVKTLEKCPNNSQIFVTGHSLGAALATLSTIHITQRFVAKQPTVKKPILYTFASPRVGNSDFAHQFKNIESYRIANSEDFVVTVPHSTGLLRPKSKSNNLASTPSSEVNKENIENLAHEFKIGSIQQVFEHVGEPLYFTCQKGSLTENHDMSHTYKKALCLNSISQVENQNPIDLLDRVS